LDWIEQGLMSNPTHFRSLRRRWGDCGISQDCSADCSCSPSHRVCGVE